MTISEFERHRLFQWFEESMGPERAATMMEVLPPVNWTEVATTTDVRTLGVELRGEIAELRGELKGDLATHTRLLFFGMVGSNATLVVLVLAVVRFYGS